MIKKLIIFGCKKKVLCQLGALLFWCFSNAHVLASQHFCDCHDTEFLALAQKFPSVGYFSGTNGLPFGSGVLVDIGSCKGSVIITCAHIFDDLKNATIYFNREGGVSEGKLLVHPTYKELYKQKGIPITSYDIALFILNKAELTPNISAPVVFESSHEDRIKKDYISVGYGDAGHVFGNYLLKDGEKRASYSHAESKINPCESESVQESLFYDDYESGITIKKEIFYEIPGGSVLNLCPLTTGPWVNKNHQPKCNSKPWGLPGKGNSGGGIFREDGKLMGIICGGIETHQESLTIIKNTYYQKHMEEFDRIKENRLLLLKILGAPLYVINNHQNTFNKVVDEKEADMVFQPPQKDAKRDGQEGEDYCMIYGTLLSFHKEWIFNEINKIGLSQLDS